MFLFWNISFFWNKYSFKFLGHCKIDSHHFGKVKAIKINNPMHTASDRLEEKEQEMENIKKSIVKICK